MAAIEKIGFKPELTLALGVRDLTKAIAWYEKVMGAQLMYRVDDIAWCEMTSPMPGVSIGLGEQEEVEPAKHTTPTWGVKDIAAARAAIEAHGVKFDGPTRVIPGMVKLATYYDLDGNPWQLAESLGN